MARKFYFYCGSKLNVKPSVAALGFLNAKSFEKACQDKGVFYKTITEEQAVAALSKLGGIGSGCYASDPSAPQVEQDRLQKARQACTTLASIMPCYHVEPALKVEPVKVLIEA